MTKRAFILWTAVAILFLGAFSAWASMGRESLHDACREDRWIENGTSLLFLVSSVGFVVFLFRSRFLRSRSRWVYFFPVCWVLLMFFFAGEEISWGQRLFGYETPEWVAKSNKQEEFNLHNWGPLDMIGGGKYRYLTIMMLMTGLLIPLFARVPVGGRLVRFFAFPACPLAYSAFFVGAYAFGKIWHPTLDNDAAEIRELSMAAGMALFAIHGARRPGDLFLLKADEKRPAENPPA